MTRAQLAAQPFILLFALITIGLIVIFGTNMIGKVANFAQAVDTINVKKQIENNVENIYNAAPRSNKQLTLNVPTAIEGICFIDTTKPQEQEIPFEQIREEIKVLEQTNDNVFFATKEKTVEPIKIKHITAKPNPLCLKTTGTVQVILENTGSEVTISHE